MSDIIMSVQELIDSAFVEDGNNNVVNFRLLKTILVILANQLRVLDRHVQVNMSRSRVTECGSSLIVSELKIHFENKKKAKKGRISASSKRHESLKDVPQTYIPEIPEGAVVCKSAPHIDMEDQNERELRVIDQRANSHEEPSLTPIPMASAHSIYEDKLLVVGTAGSTFNNGRPPRVSIVTREQFDKLANAVRELQAQCKPIGIPGFPENAEFLKALRNGASLTEAMAALQISARLQAFEKAFGMMLSLLTEVAKNTPGVDVSEFQDFEKDFEKGLWKSSVMQEHTEETDIKRDVSVAQKKVEQRRTVRVGHENYVTQKEFSTAMTELYDEIMENLKQMDTSTKAEVLKLEKTLNHFEQQTPLPQNFGDRLNELEVAVDEYEEKINELDTELTSQITNYQEQLAQVQQDLETGLDNLAETIASTSLDPEVIVELNKKFIALQEDLENSSIVQRESKVFQSNMALDLAGLWKQIELLRDTKADREEVSDTLRDKVGIGELNGMVSLEYFHAVQGDLEAKINASYGKFNNQELTWQKAIDDLIRAINEKADYSLYCGLRNNINDHLNELRKKIRVLSDIVGEPHAAATSKILFRDTECISCRIPARMDIKEPERVPVLPTFTKPTADSGDATNQSERSGDYGICYKNQPIPNPRDPRSHVCKRYCGGSHTTMTTVSRAPPGMKITPLPRECSNIVGTDGKAYKTDIPKLKKPCIPCNHPKTPQPTEAGTVSEPEKFISTTLSSDMMSGMDWLTGQKYDSTSITMPIPSDDF